METNQQDIAKETSPDIDDISLTNDGEILNPDKANALWDSAVKNGETPTLILTSDSNSFNQARQRGIAPDVNKHSEGRIVIFIGGVLQYPPPGLPG